METTNNNKSYTCMFRNCQETTPYVTLEWFIHNEIVVTNYKANKSTESNNADNGQEMETLNKIINRIANRMGKLFKLTSQSECSFNFRFVLFSSIF